MPRLLSIATRNASRAPMQTHETAEVTTKAGIAEDFRGKTQGRQITVIVREAWERACSDLKKEIPWTARRANLLIEGLDLHQTAGKHLHIGEVVLEITGETEPCSRMDEAHRLRPTGVRGLPAM